VSEAGETSVADLPRILGLGGTDQQGHLRRPLSDPLNVRLCLRGAPPPIRVGVTTADGGARPSRRLGGESTGTSIQTRRDVSSICCTKTCDELSVSWLEVVCRGSKSRLRPWRPRWTGSPGGPRSFRLRSTSGNLRLVNRKGPGSSNDFVGGASRLLREARVRHFRLEDPAPGSEHR
jgi:hypothetical protein